MKQIVLLTGVSGAGKNAIAKCVFLSEQKLRTDTSRNPREGEIDGIDYYFKSKEEMLNGIEKNEYIEFESFVNGIYGLTKIEFQNKFNKGDVYIILNSKGIPKYKKLFPSSISIFIDIDLDDAIANMRDRGDNERDIQDRIKKYEEESNIKPFCDYVILNKRGFLNESIQAMKDIIQKK